MSRRPTTYQRVLSDALPTLDTPDGAAPDAVRGGFLGGLINHAATVVRSVAPNATPSVPIPPPAE